MTTNSSPSMGLHLDRALPQDPLSHSPISHPPGRQSPGVPAQATSKGSRGTSCREACLVLVSGSASTPVLDLSQRTHVSLGRQLENCLVVQDPTCSRRHCLLTRVDHQWYVEDLFSRNGTFVNGQRVFQDYLLCSGDLLLIGCTRFQFTEVPQTDA